MTSSQEFNLRWNNHTNNILQVFSEQFNTESLVDVTLSCEGQFLKVHRMVLSACSPYFQEIFRHPLHQVPNAMIIMNGMKFADIKLVVEFMYKGEVKVVETELNGLLAAAETLQVKGLSNVRNKYEKGDILNGAAGLGSTSDSPNTQQDVMGTPIHLRRKRQRLSEEMGTEGRAREPLPAGNGQSSIPPLGHSMVQKSAMTGGLVKMPALHNPANSFLDDDDLPATIKVEPPDIRDIDEEPEPGGWESPKLVIDMEDAGRANRANRAIGDEQPARLPKRMLVNSILVKRGRGRPKKLAALVEPDPGTEEDGEGAAAPSSPPMPPPPPPPASAPNKRPSRKKLVPGSAAWLRKRAGKIPRPPNAFMIFANEYRRKLAGDNPSENNKEISCRLGSMWKNLPAEVKETYYTQSREADEEHKRMYPGYYYSPKEARLRKNMKADMAELRRAPPHAENKYLFNVVMPDDNTDDVLPARFLLYDGMCSPPLLPKPAAAAAPSPTLTKHQPIMPKPASATAHLSQQLRPEELLVVQLEDGKVKFDSHKPAAAAAAAVVLKEDTAGNDKVAV